MIWSSAGEIWAWNLPVLIQKYHRAEPKQAESRREIKVMEAGVVLNPFRTKFDRGYFENLAESITCDSPAIAALMVVFLIGGLVSTLKKRPVFALFAFLWFGVPAAILAFSPVRFFFPPRYLIFLSPVFVILVALGLVEAVGWVSNRVLGACRNFARMHEALFARLGVFLATLTVLAMVSSFSEQIWKYFQSEKQNWRGAVGWLEQNLESGDTVLTGQGWTELGVLYYRRDDSKRIYVIARYFNLELFEHALGEIENLWYVSWGPLPTPVKECMDKHLSLVKMFPGCNGNIEIYKKFGSGDHESKKQKTPKCE